MPAAGLGFDQPVALNGYRWWYLDALSDDRSSSLTLIAFIGSVFSPYYASARRRGPADPRNFCAINLSLHHQRKHLWTLTERSTDALARSSNTLTIGPSSIDCSPDRITFNLVETTFPLPAPVRGRVTFTPFYMNGKRVPLDETGNHSWLPLAPHGHVEVDLNVPSWRWRGSGYLDSNEGVEPLENAFSGWHWSRAQLDDGTAILYELQARAGDSRTIALHFNHTGERRDFTPPPICELTSSRWKIPRVTRSEDAARTRVRQTLLDAPFYARSLVSTKLLGHSVTAVHESLDLNRFSQPWVQTLLKFRIARPLRFGRRS